MYIVLQEVMRGKKNRCSFIKKYMCVCLFKTDEAFVTLATTDSYAKGALVLGQSLRNHNTSKKLVVLVGPHVAEPCR